MIVSQDLWIKSLSLTLALSKLWTCISRHLVSLRLRLTCFPQFATLAVTFLMRFLYSTLWWRSIQKKWLHSKVIRIVSRVSLILSQEASVGLLAKPHTNLSKSRRRMRKRKKKRVLLIPKKKLRRCMTWLFSLTCWAEVSRTETFTYSLMNHKHRFKT